MVTMVFPLFMCLFLLMAFHCRHLLYVVSQRHPAELHVDFFQSSQMESLEA
jgi:hypothetical protein